MGDGLWITDHKTIASQRASQLIQRPIRLCPVIIEVCGAPGTHYLVWPKVKLGDGGPRRRTIWRYLINRYAAKAVKT